MELMKGESKADGELPEDLARFRAVKARAKQITGGAGSELRKGKKGGN